MIECRQLSKSFTQYQKEPGLRGSIKSFIKRRYVKKHAVEGFDLKVNKGEMIGLLGPNGAGKTTLMKMFTGIIVPSSGELSVMGYEPFQRSMGFRKKIALVMGQKSQLWWDIPAMDSFLLLQKYYEIPQQTFQDRLNELVSLLDVKSLLHVHVRKLSLGERMKMELMASLLHNPEVIFLDEPTIGLDLVAQQKIREFIASYQKQHDTTVILTSHYMADVAALCSRIVLILNGRKRFDGSITTFENILGREKFVTMSFHEAVNSQDPVWQNLDAQWNASFTKVDLRIAEQELRQTTIDILQRFPVSDLSTEKLPIERVMNTLLKDPDLLPVE
ncbi:MAG: ABC transporter ATP-binding protein [Oligoflexus sp.]